ncbi:MAG: type II toxin-antitoxin system RelE/ParE family toxin [Nitrospinota bacterium]
MIKSFADKASRDIYDGVNSRYARKIPNVLHPKIRRLFDQINAAPSVEFLRIPPGNRLEKLRGDLKRFWSLRINDQWRMIFEWKDNNAFKVKIADYH